MQPPVQHSNTVITASMQTVILNHFPLHLSISSFHPHTLHVSVLILSCVLSTSLYCMTFATRVCMLHSNKTQCRESAMLAMLSFYMMIIIDISLAALATSMLTVSLWSQVSLYYPFRCFQNYLSYYQIRLHCFRTSVSGLL